MGFLLKFACAFIVFLTVFFYLLYGLAITVIGVCIKEILYTAEPYLNQQEYVYSPTVLIITGIVLLLISLTGGYALVTKKFYASLLFTIFLSLKLFSEISLVLTAYIMREEIKYFFETWLPSIWLYHVSADVHLMWDIVQWSCKCCGVHNYTDWKRVEHIMPIPKTCYNYGDENFQFYKIGCIEGVGNFFKEYSNTFVTFGVIMVMIQLIGIISARSLTRMYRKRCKLLYTKKTCLRLIC